MVLIGSSGFFATLALAVLPALALSQDLGAISGVVADSSGGVLEGATVVVKNLETGAARQVTSDAAGRYAVPALAVGKYRVTANKSGFQAASRTGVVLVAGEQAEEDLELGVGALSEVVTVEDVAPPVSVSTQQTSGLVGEEQVKDLPLNGRSYDELMTLNPGVVNYTSERSGGVGTSNSAIGNMFSVSGRRPQESVFLLNDIEYTGASEINLTPGGASGELLGVDGVREFNVVADTYGAEYGKRPGAQVSVTTTSGSNTLHGTVYEFLRNSALDARNFFDQASIAPFERNEFGGALGGPVQTDRTFAFADFEGFQQRLGLSDVTLVPDANARLGLLPDSSGKLVNVGIVPSTKALMNLWPVANGPDLGGGIAESFSQPLQHIREDFGTARLDHVFSDRDTFASVYTADNSSAQTPTVNPLSSLAIDEIEQVASVEETHVFSPRLVNTARAGFSRASMAFEGEVGDTGIPGWISGDPIGAVVVGGGTASNSATQISGAGANVASNTDAARNLFTYSDELDLNLGAHHWQAGVWVQRIQANDTFAQDQYGQASFSSLTALLQGKVTTFTAVPNTTPLGWRSLEGAWYVQDTWKLSPKIELRLGFRAESTNGWNEAHGRAANYLFSAGGVIATEPAVSSSALTVNHAGFLPEPRAGLAWAPFGPNSTVIHAGFGIYEGLLDNLSYRLDQDAPFNTTVTLKNVALSSLAFVPGGAIPAGGLISPAGVQPNAYTPTVASYTLRVEQRLDQHTSLSVGYAGSHGYHELLSVDANVPNPTICPASPCPASLPAGTLYIAKGTPLPNPALANTTSWFSEGVSSYNALQVDVNRRPIHGLTLRGVYTYSKSLDDGGTLNTSVGTNTPAFTSYPLNPKLDWGLSPFNVKNLAAINGNYELPFGTGKAFAHPNSNFASELASGWSIASVVSVQSGLPFSPQLGYNPSNDGDSRNPVRPSWNPDFSGPVILGGPSEYFNPNAFIAPASGTYGNAGRDVLIGPGLATADISALKVTRIHERLNLQFRAELFNVLNHTNFNTPNPVVFTSASSGISPTAGLISSTTTTSRQIQFGLKLLF
jgi:hypothetical protein